MIRTPSSLTTLRSAALAVTGFLALVLATTPAFAQVPAPFVGVWKATWATDKKSYEALMTVTNAGGTWQTAARDGNNPCVGREVPMKIESSTATEVLFLLQFSEVITGCPNVKVSLKAAPDGSITGTRSKFELTLVRSK